MASRSPRLVPFVTSVIRFMRQVVHPDWYPVLPLFSGTCICGKSFTQIGTLSTSVFRYMWQVVHPDWYPVLPLFSGICGKSFTQIGTLCYLCFQVYAPGHSPRLVPFVSSPELLGSQGELIVYPCSGVRPSYVVRPQFQTSSPLKPLGQSKPNFMWSLLGKGERKFI